MADKVQAIVIAPGSSTELIPALKKARAAGIRIVNIDNQLDPAACAAAGLNGVPFISVDNVRGAFLSAGYLVAGVKSPAEAAILEGIRSANNANQRKAGALDAFKANTNVTMVASETANWKIDEGREATARIMAAHPHVGYIFAANDMMALGALQYLKEKGLSRVKVAGFDDLEEARTAIREGRMVATVDQQADLQGYMGCDAAMELLAGREVAPAVLVDVRLVTRETVGA